MDFWLIDPCGCQAAGAERMRSRTAGLANQLQSAGHQATLWRSAVVPPQQTPGVSAVRELRELEAICAPARGPSAIFVSLASLAAAELAMRHAQTYRVPLIVDLPGTSVPRVACHQLSASWPVVGGWLRASRSTLRRVFEAAAGLVCVTPACVEAFRTLLPPRLITHAALLPATTMANCPHDEDLESARATLEHVGVDFGRTIGLVTGDFTNRRAASAIGQAAFLLNHRLELQLVVRGGSDQVEPIRRVAHAARNIVLLDHLDAKQWQALLRAARFGILAGDKSFVLEQPAAMADFVATGLPIIVPREGLYAESVANRELGSTYWSRNARDLARTIVRTTEDIDRLASYRTAVASHAKTGRFEVEAKAAAELLARVATASGRSIRRAA